MRAYSMDLRERVLHDSDAGMQAAAVASKYRVSASWVRRLKQRRRETGEVAPRQQRYGRHPVLAPQLHTLAALIRELAAQYHCMKGEYHRRQRRQRDERCRRSNVPFAQMELAESFNATQRRRQRGVAIGTVPPVDGPCRPKGADRTARTAILFMRQTLSGSTRTVCSDRDLPAHMWVLGARLTNGGLINSERRKHPVFGEALRRHAGGATYLYQLPELQDVGAWPRRDGIKRCRHIG